METGMVARVAIMGIKMKRGSRGIMISNPALTIDTANMFSICMTIEIEKVFAMMLLLDLYREK